MALLRAIYATIALAFWRGVLVAGELDYLWTGREWPHVLDVRWRLWQLEWMREGVHK